MNPLPREFPLDEAHIDFLDKEAIENKKGEITDPSRLFSSAGFTKSGFYNT